VTAERRAVVDQVDALGIRCRSIEQSIGQLSGGNQQKVVLARSLLTEPSVLVLDEPTRGVDVGAKEEIHRHIRRLADDGCAVLLISSELDEVIQHADRVLVFREGQLAGEFDASQTTAADVARCALPVVGADKANESRRTKRSYRRFTLPYSEIGLAVAIALLALWLALGNEQFWTPENRLGILTGASVWTILALGAAAVIIAGGIDISIGSLLALSAGCGGLTVLKLSGYPPPVAICAGIAVGLTVGTLGGLTNASLSLIGRVHPIVVTLGTMTIYRGMLIALTGGDVVAGLPPAFGRMATWRLVDVPVIGSINGALVALAVTACAAYIWLGHTRSGRHIYALGSSPSAARLAGISQRRVWLTAFAGGGLLTGVAAMLELAKTGSMQSVMGTGYELRAIAAAVIGGVAITGGRGSVAGVVLGALLLSLLDNALVLWEVPPFQNQLVIGALILVAIMLDRLWRWFDRRTTS
jgi:ribose/xylose/arabinose/galactoside ABC-type transport system permease subunit